MTRYRVEFTNGNSKVLEKDKMIRQFEPDRFEVKKVEKINVDSEFIEAKIDDALRTAFSEILNQHSIKSGDVRPEMKQEIDDIKDDLKNSTKVWIRGRL
jgi:hypothetical protein